MKTLSILAAMIMALPAAAALPDYDAVVTEVLSQGYGIKADSLRMAAEVADVRAENVPEGPEAEFEHLWPSAPGPDNRWSAGVSQSFDWPGAYRARSRQADAMSAASREILRGVALDKALSAKLLVLDIINARQRLALCEEVAAGVRRVDSLTRRAYDLEAATVLDLRKTRLAVLDAERGIALARADIEALEASLVALGPAGINTAAWLEYPAQTLSPAPFNPEEYPEYRAARARMGEAAARLSALRASSWPGITLGYRHAYEEGRHFNGLTVGLRLPSWSRKRRTEAARLEAEAIIADDTAVLARTFSEEEALRTTVRDLAAAMEKYRGLSDDNTYMPLLQKAFDGGELTVIDFINEVNIFRSARLNYIDLDYRCQLALARLNRARSAYFN